MHPLVTRFMNILFGGILLPFRILFSLHICILYVCYVSCMCVLWISGAFIILGASVLHRLCMAICDYRSICLIMICQMSTKFPK
jgi:hypothetical protein